jgi:putative ABC transport system substrate-binding protein
MKRREFVGGFGAAAAWPLAARPQPAMPTIGFLSGSSPSTIVPYGASLHRGLKETGFVEGQNLKVEYRWAETHYGRLPAMARQLVDLKVNAIVTVGGNDAAHAAKQATSNIPIVFSAAEDPIETGLVASLSRPEGNVTGVSWMGADLQAKSVELIHELLPNSAIVGMLLNPGRPSAAVQLTRAQQAAGRFGKTIRALQASNDNEIDSAFQAIAKERIGALIVGTDPLFNIRRQKIVMLAANHAIPTTYYLRDFVAAGGLMSYGSSLSDAYVLVGNYAGRILKGAKPVDLPIQRMTRVELVLNLKTAKALGLTIPITVLGRADEVIE